MTDWLEKANERKKRYFEEAIHECNKLAAQQKDLSSEDRLRLSEGCVVNKIKKINAIEDCCIIDTSSKWLFKGRRLQQCMKLGLESQAFDSFQFVQQKADEIRAEKRALSEKRAELKTWVEQLWADIETPSKKTLTKPAVIASKENPKFKFDEEKSELPSSITLYESPEKIRVAVTPQFEARFEVPDGKSKTIPKLENVILNCIKCDWSQEKSLPKLRELFKLPNFKCPKCGSNQYKITEKQRRTYTWVDSEEDLDYILKIGFLNRGIPIWNCGAESGKCDDPIIIDDIEFQIYAGDFPFFYGGLYKVIESKFLTNRCSNRTASGKITHSIKLRALKETQWQLLLSGGGFLVIVSESPPSKYGLWEIMGNTKAECEDLLNTKYKQKLANNEIPYEVWVLDQHNFEKLFNEKLRYKKGRNQAIFGEWTSYGIKKPKSIQKFINIGRNDLEECVPNCKSQLTMTQLMEGAVTDIILNFMDK